MIPNLRRAAGKLFGSPAHVLLGTRTRQTFSLPRSFVQSDFASAPLIFPQRPTVSSWFYKGPGNSFDKLIKWWGRPKWYRFWELGKYSHVEIEVMDQGCVGRAYAADGYTGKVRTASVYQFNWGNWDTIPVELVKDMTWLDAQVDKGYDWLGIFGFVTLGVEDRSRWYCSELAAAALGLDTKKISPIELYEKVKV